MQLYKLSINKFQPSIFVDLLILATALCQLWHIPRFRF